jgi:hypothetical protein
MAAEPITPPPSHNGAHVQVEKRTITAAAPAYTHILRWMLSRLVPVATPAQPVTCGGRRPWPMIGHGAKRPQQSLDRGPGAGVLGMRPQ